MQETSLQSSDNIKSVYFCFITENKINIETMKIYDNISKVSVSCLVLSQVMSL